MRISEAFPSNYLRAADLMGKQIKVVVARVEMENIGDDVKPVLYFHGKDKGVVLNKTNANNIALAYGDDTDNWTGAEIILYETMVDFQGRSVAAIRVRVPPRVPARARPAPAPVQREDAPPPTAAPLHDDGDDIPF